MATKKSKKKKATKKSASKKRPKVVLSVRVSEPTKRSLINMAKGAKVSSIGELLEIIVGNKERITPYFKR